MVTSKKHPSHLLRNLAIRGQRISSQREIKPEAGNIWTGIGFSLCGHHMVVPMGEVVEILEVPEVTTVPGVKSWVNGIANLRGRLLTVVDLEKFFGARLLGNKNYHRVLIVEKYPVYAGLVVSSVSGLKHFSGDLGKVDQPGEDDLQTFIEGVRHDNGSIWHVFSTDKLVKSQLFLGASVNDFYEPVQQNAG